jgi:hypothetical protein
MNGLGCLNESAIIQQKFCDSLVTSLGTDFGFPKNARQGRLGVDEQHS